MITACLRNAVVMFDDVYIPRNYALLVGEHGRIKTAAMLFLGADLSREYRTYGLSRLIQFLLWNFVGARSYVYPLIIGVSQCLTAVMLLSILRVRNVTEPVANFIAIAWLLSPFSVTSVFHFYTYLILPFQLVVATVFLSDHPGRFRYQKLVFCVLGVACALTGELHIPVVLLLFSYFSFFSPDRRRRILFLIALCSFAAALAVHRTLWVLFFQNIDAKQRFSLTLGNTAISEVPWISFAIGKSILSAGLQQIDAIFDSGVKSGLLFGALFGLIFWASQRKAMPRTDHEMNGFRIAAVAFVLGFACIVVYFVLATFLGDRLYEMPRRYGYVSLTLIFISVVVFIGETLSLLSWPTMHARPIVYALLVGLMATISFQLQAVALKRERAIDRGIVSEVLRGRGEDSAAGNSEKTVLFFVASDPKYWADEGNPTAIGPKTDSVLRRELLESPFGVFWTAKSYAVDFLGFKYSGMTSGCQVSSAAEPNHILLCDSNWAYPFSKNEVSTRDAIVIANLGLEKFDPEGKNIKIFQSFDDFRPNDFSRRIDRSPLLSSGVVANEISIDLGRVSQSVLADGFIFPDKKMRDPNPNRVNWISNYGYIEGDDSIYSHPDIRHDLVTYKTNRNGSFAYGVDFAMPMAVEVSLDFWEQWGRQPGERLFDLQVKWGDGAWADVDVIDLAKINGNRPFAIVLGKKGVTSFQFRLRSLAGSKDVPVIQNLRIRKI